MTSSKQYKRQIMNDLAQGILSQMMRQRAEQEYENFDDFAQRSSHEERRQLFGKSLHPDRIPSSRGPELQKSDP